MTDLDMDALTGAQRDTIGLIAIGQDGGHNPRTLAALERMGLIVGHRQTVPVQMGSATLGMEVTRWEVPIPVHMQWCAWCSTHVDDEEVDDA